ncbi:MAG: thiamine biosynthesis protein ThiS [Robiginitomaculum sp.]|nr:MAG: thiamine biosynthesis protein ThiS [Robiginitomaculum sp.]
MEISINGEDRQLDGAPSIADMLIGLQLNPDKVAVECNLEIVPHSLFAQTVLQSGDRLEIVRFIGGG